MKSKKILFILTIMLFTASLAFGSYVEIGTGTGYTPTYGPFYNYYENNKTQTLYLQSELGSAMTITQISFNIEQVATTQRDLVNFTINFLHTDDTEFTPGSYHDMTGATQVFFSNPYTLATSTGWTDIDITDFAYNGTQNLIVEVIWGDQGDYAWTYYRNYKTSSSGTCRMLYGYADSETPPSYIGSAEYFSNMRFHYSTPHDFATLDHATDARSMPDTTVAGGSSVTFHIVAKNFGTTTESSPIKWTCTGGTPTSDTDENTASLAQDATEHHIFSPTWTAPATAGTYTVKFYTDLATDTDHSNDTTEVQITVCAPYSLPFTDGFEGATPPDFPACWAVTNDGAGNEWDTQAWPTYAHSGDIMARYHYDSSDPADTWLFTPALSMNSGISYRVKFWYRGRSTSYTEKLEVYICDGQTSADTLSGGQIWDNDNITNNTYQEAKANFTVPSNGTYYVGFHCYSDANQYDLYVDDVTVEETPPVPEMILSETSHDFGYVEEGTSADWDVTISNTGAADLVISGTTVGSPFSCSYTGTIGPGLSDDATISFSPAKGSYTDTLVFHNNATCCDSEVVLTGSSYPSGHNFQGFEDTTFPPDGWAMTSGWSRYTYSSHVYEGDASAKVSGDNTSWLFTPALDINTGDQLSFYYQAESASYPSGLKVRLATVSKAAQTDTTAYTVTLIDLDNIDNTDWKDTTYTFDATYNGQQVYLAFQRSWQTSTNWYAFIDAVIHPSRYWGTPGTPANPSPADLSTGQLLAGTLDWDDCQYAQTYDVYLENVNPPTVKIAEDISHSDTLYSVPNLNTTYYWKVVAKNPGAKLETEGPVWSFTTIGACHGLPLTEDFESGFDIFDNASGNDSLWILNDTLFTSTTHSAWNPYGASNENILVQTCVMDLTAKANPVLSFNHIAKTEGDWDHCYVEISTDAGATWIILPDSLYHGSGTYENPLYGNPEGPCFDEDSYTEWGTGTEIPDNTWWKQEAFDLIPYNTSSQTMIRFRLTSDGSGQRFGWLIDDISIEEWAAPGAPTDPAPAHNAIGVALLPTLSWTNNGVVDSSIVQWEKTSGGTVYKDTVYTNSCTVTDSLEKGTEYKWKVTCYNPMGNTTGSWWHFTTAGDGNIDGIVYYDDGSKSQVPIENAVVTCEGVSDTTDAAGNYFLGPIPSGERVITTEHINFVTKLDTVNIPLNDTLHYDIEMQWDLHPPRNLAATAWSGSVALEWQEPLPLGEIKYDDNSAESWYYFTSADTNYFYCNMFNAPIAGDITHIALCTYTNGPNWYQVRMCPDDGTGDPDLDNPYESFSNVSTASTPQWIVLQLTTPQTMAVGDTFWVVAQYSSPSSNGPYLGSDTNSPDQDMSYYTTDHGNTYYNVSGNHFMRAYMTTAKGQFVTLTSESNSNLCNLPIYNETGNLKSPEMAEIAMSHRKTNTIAMSYTVPAIIATGTKGDKALTNYKLYRGTISGSYTYLDTTSALTYTDNTVSNNTEYFYVVSAVYDQGESGYSNEVDAYPMAAATPPYFSNFDAKDTGGFHGTGDWECGPPTYADGPAAYSSPNVWGTVLDGDYSLNSNSNLYQPFDLSAKGYGYKVNFAHWDSMETNCDYGYFAVDHDNDGVYNILATYTGYNTTWTEAELIIPDSLCTAYTKLAFIFTSDGNVVKPGFYIDNLGIDEYIPPQISIDPTSFTKTLLQNNTTTDTLTIGNPARATQDDLIYTATVSGAGDAVEDFETTNGDYIHGMWDGTNDTWDWGVPDYIDGPATAHSGTKCWGTNLTGDFLNCEYSYLQSIEFDLSVATDPELVYYHWYNMGSIPYDGVCVMVSDDNGTSWNLITPDGGYPCASCNWLPNDEAGFSGTLTTWTEVRFDLSLYVGETILVRWYLGTSTVVPNPGYYLDDVKITGLPQLVWLTLDGETSTSDTISVGNTDDIIVGFDATGLVVDSTYTTKILITSNDPNSPTDTVAVTLNVDGPPEVVIEMVADGDSVRLSWVDKGYTYYVYSNDDPYDAYPGNWFLEDTVSGVGEVTLPTPGDKKFYIVIADTAKGVVTKPVIIHRHRVMK